MKQSRCRCATTSWYLLKVNVQKHRRPRVTFQTAAGWEMWLFFF